MTSDETAERLCAAFRAQLDGADLTDMLVNALSRFYADRPAAGTGRDRIAARSVQLLAEWDEFQRRTDQRERIEAVLGPGPHRLSDLGAVYGRGRVIGRLLYSLD